MASFLATSFRRQPKRPPLISPPCSSALQGASSVAVCPAAGVCRRLIKCLTSPGPPSSCWAHQMFGGSLLAWPRVSAADPSAPSGLPPSCPLPAPIKLLGVWPRVFPQPPSQEILVTTWRLCEIPVEACPLGMHSAGALRQAGASGDLSRMIGSAV